MAQHEEVLKASNGYSGENAKKGVLIPMFKYVRDSYMTKVINFLTVALGKHFS